MEGSFFKEFEGAEVRAPVNAIIRLLGGGSSQMVQEFRQPFGLGCDWGGFVGNGVKVCLHNVL